MSEPSLSDPKADPNRRLRVLVGSPGKHLFLRLRDPRVRLYLGEPNDEATPDLVVFPCSQYRELDSLADRLPSVTRARLVSGKARPVFDASGEGRAFHPDEAARLHGFVASLGGPVGRAVYVTQNRRYAKEYRAHCQRSGLDRSMTILTYDYWIKRFFVPYEIRGPAILAQRLEAFRARSAQRDRRFISLNWSVRPIKTLFLLRLMHEGLWEQGFVSFGGFDRQAGVNGRTLDRETKLTRSMHGFKDLYADVSGSLPRLVGLGRVQLGDVGPDAAPHEQIFTSDMDLVEYGRSWFSVVNETEMWNRPVRITEKPFKPLVNFHPIVVFGNPGALAAIRALGFRTFPELFDESYDDEPSPRRRFDMAFAELARLCRMDEDELARRIAGVAETLEYNARFGLTELPGLYRNEIDRALVDQLAR